MVDPMDLVNDICLWIGTTSSLHMSLHYSCSLALVPSRILFSSSLQWLFVGVQGTHSLLQSCWLRRTPSTSLDY